MYRLIVSCTLVSLVAGNPIGLYKPLAAQDSTPSYGESLLDTVNKYRIAYGLDTLSWDDDV